MELSFIFAYGMLSNVSKTGNVFTVYFFPSNFLVNEKFVTTYIQETMKLSDEGKLNLL